tara:strand:- start:446 stop:595 length:150 start_codon:yes stop_codon:yes gene_type:complete
VGETFVVAVIKVMFGSSLNDRALIHFDLSLLALIKYGALEGAFRNRGKK